MLSKYRNARISVSGGTDISGASTGGGGGRGGGGGGGGGGSNRLKMIVQGPDIDQLQKYANTLLDEGEGDRRRRRRRHQLRSDAARAAHRHRPRSARPTSACRSIRCRRPCARWSAARKCRSSRTATISSASGCGSTSRSATIRRRWATSSCPPPGGRMVRVSDVAHLTIGNAPASIDRYNRHAADLGERQPRGAGSARRGARGSARARSASSDLKAGLSGGRSAAARARSAEASQQLRDRASSSPSLFIYMVLASQFNSFVHPLTIMTALPLSLPAGLLALMAFGMTINVYSAIGLMMLFGIVKKNSILQVDYTNTLRAQGMERHERDRPGQPRPAAADSDDDDRDRRRDAADRVRPRRRRRARARRWRSRSSAARCSACC